MKKFLLLIGFVTISIACVADIWDERKLPNGGYARVAYMSSEGVLCVSIQTDQKSEYMIDISVTCTHKWRTNDVYNSDGTKSPGTWEEEQYTVCNQTYRNIPVNELVKLTDGINNPPANTRTNYYMDYSVTINNIETTSDNTYRMIFYVWGRGTIVDDHASSTGHAFVYIPEIGYTGFGVISEEDGKLETFVKKYTSESSTLASYAEYWGSPGAIVDHEDYLGYATDYCVIEISRKQLDMAKKKYYALLNNTPKYYVGKYDCTSFVMDIADAAGIKYGFREIIQWPVGFMQELKKHNPSKRN